jgi:hypothetical protein
MFRLLRNQSLSVLAAFLGLAGAPTLAQADDALPAESTLRASWTAAAATHRVR